MKPQLNDTISLDDFKQCYWLKSDLVLFCRNWNIPASGGKEEIANRIIFFLQTGEILQPLKKQNSISTFNWHKTSLSLSTLITDNYSNSQNVRAFMTQHIGTHFKFNTEFMEWMKLNVGKTMQNAIDEWKRIYELKKDKNYKTVISPQFEYNAYIRDFMAQNPSLTIKDAMEYWKLKREQKGSKCYSSNDLNLKRI